MKAAFDTLQEEKRVILKEIEILREWDDHLAAFLRKEGRLNELEYWLNVRERNKILN